MFCIYLKKVDVQSKGSVRGFKQTEMFITSPDVIGTCTNHSKKEKNSEVQAKVVTKRAFFKISYPSETLYSCYEEKESNDRSYLDPISYHHVPSSYPSASVGAGGLCSEVTGSSKMPS